MGKRYTDEDRKKIVEERGYELLEINRKRNKKGKSKVYIKIKCDKGHITEMQWDNFMQGKNCKYCANNVAFTYKEVKEYTESFGYELLSEEYKGSNSPLIIKCPQGHVTDTITYSRFKLGCRCKKCADEKRGDNKKLSYEEVEVKGYIESFEYKLLSTEYEKSNKKLLIQCNKKHEPYLASWNDFQQGCRCPYCNESKGEKRIEEFLNINNISYIPQYRFKDCKFKNTLPFDFYLLDYNVLIEYDGEQHYKIKDIFGGLDGFVDRIIRDTIKNEYCKKNNIKLIRIPYWDFNNIEKIIVKELNLK